MSKIKNIEVYCVGPNSSKVTWSALLGPMFEALVIVKIIDEDGLEGISGTTVYTEHQFDLSVFESVNLMAPFLLQAEIENIQQIEQLNNHLAIRYIPLNTSALSLFDIACYDLLSKKASLPLYQYLGAKKHSLKAYASSPLLENNREYINYCYQMMELGFKSIKIHPYCIYDKDITLVKAINQEFDGELVGWSFDVDGSYTLLEAKKLCAILEANNWEFFEEPINDSDFLGYQELVKEFNIDIVPGGNCIKNYSLFELACKMKVWDRIRFDTTTIGGVTTALKCLQLADKYDLKAEIQSWGYSLTQAVNLHLMLSSQNTVYFEIAAPYHKYEFACKQNFRPDSEGFIKPNHLAGLGIEMDWDQLNPFIYAQRKF